MKYKVDDPWANRIRTRHVTTETPSTTTDIEVNKVLDSYSYKLKLLHKLEKIHNIFHPSFLCFTNQLFLPGQIDLLSPPITIDKNKKKL
jgi:hypothetical protein